MANYLVAEWSNTGNVLLNPPQLEALASRSVIARDGFAVGNAVLMQYKAELSEGNILSIHGKLLMSFICRKMYSLTRDFQVSFHKKAISVELFK